MRIGLSIITGAKHNVWNNGIGQNIYFLATLLEGLPFVADVVLINTGDEPNPPGDAGLLGQRYALVEADEALDRVDVAIEISGALGMDWLREFRARRAGGLLNCGQPYFGLVEPSVFGRSGYLGDTGRCDELWLLPKDRAFAPMMRTLYRSPVHEVPYIWSPAFLLESLKRNAAEGLGFGFKPGMMAKGAAVPAIFEPNLSPGKMGIIPFMISEKVQRAMPEAMAMLLFMNSKKMAENPTFVAMMVQSQLYKAGKVVVAGRDYFAHVMGVGANMVISHQDDWGQNYLYLDALYGDYPLIHNSPFFADAGYYYPATTLPRAPPRCCARWPSMSAIWRPIPPATAR
jgi:hypothetical protein